MTYQTSQKNAILEWLMGVKTHPSAQEVYEGVKEKLPNIGVATVYRNLDKLVEEGKIKEFDFGEKKKRYDGAVHPHQHFVCTQCARVIDMELSKLLNIEKTVEKVQCHRVESYELELRGVCSSCLSDRGQPSAVSSGRTEAAGIGIL